MHDVRAPPRPRVKCHIGTRAKGRRTPSGRRPNGRPRKRRFSARPPPSTGVGGTKRISPPDIDRHVWFESIKTRAYAAVIFSLRRFATIYSALSDPRSRHVHRTRFDSADTFGDLSRNSLFQFNTPDGPRYAHVLNDRDRDPKRDRNDRVAHEIGTRTEYLNS